MNSVFNILSITLVLLATSSLRAQEIPAEKASPCIAEPVFHCVKPLEGGSAIGHFGYRLNCPDDDDTAEELFVEIGPDNLFAPGPRDRGQPKVFLPGEHVDEFEVEFSLAEVKGNVAIIWSVLGQTATVDFTRTKDASLDCSLLP